MRVKKRIQRRILIFLILAALAAMGTALAAQHAEYGFARSVPPEEAELRLLLVHTAENWLGRNEADASHASIIDLYNSHMPLARDYLVTYEDNWCAAYVSAAAIQCGLTDIIPTECGCERQTELFRELGRWEESDSYLPLPGDLIYYAWEDWPVGDCKGWADHVGIVAGTWGPFIKVIEGNWKDAVSYRILLRNHYEIRGFGLPDYETKSK